MANDVIGSIILTVYRFPQLIQNKTLTEVFTTIVSDTTILNHVAQASGIANTTIIDAINLYLTVVSYLNPTATPPTNSSNATLNNTQPCIPLGQGDFTAFSLLPSFFIIFVLSLLTKRRRPKKRCGVLWKRPGLCIPLNLVDDYENRLAYACAFGATVSKCLSILFFSNYQEVFSQELVKIQQDPTNPGWVGVFWKMLAMVYIGVAYYPMFACMSTEYKLIGGIIGFFYSFLWLIVTLIYVVQCPKYLLTIVYPGDRFAWSLSETICIFLLVCMYFIIVVKCLVNFVRRRSSRQTDTYEIELWKHSYKYKYVVKLLQAIPKECREQKALYKIKSKIYRWKPEFKYSTRVVCIYVVSLIIVYQASIGLVVIAGLLFKFLFRLTMIYTFESIGIATSLVQQWLFIAYVAWFVALGISIIYSIVLVANMLSWYRGHLARLQRGDKSFLPVQVLEKSPSSITVATLKYSGYQVAYVAWSFIILHTLLFVIGSVIGIQLIYPIKQYKFNTFLWTKVLGIWPAVVVSLLFYLCQFLLAKFVFLHSRGSSLALDNRRLFHICTYFLFFFNIFLGLISCLKRIIFGAVIGVLFLGRLQKSSLPRDFELRDPGFNAYVGYLYLEHTHSNPVLVTFCRLLLLSLGDEDITRPSSKIADDREAQKNCPTSDIYRDRRRKRIRNRWALFLTLSNNPELKQERKRDKFIQKSPLQALSIMVNDLTLLPAQHSPQNHVDSYGLEGITKHDEELEHTSKL